MKQAELRKQLHEDLMRPRHRGGWVLMANNALVNTDQIPILFDFLIHGEERVARTCAEVIRFISDQNKNVCLPFIDSLVGKLNTKCHNGIKRSIFRMFQRASFKEDQAGPVVEVAFNHLNDLSEPVAVRVFAMTTIYNLTKVYPELYDELVAVISTNLDQQSTGFQNRAQKIINQSWK